VASAEMLGEEAFGGAEHGDEVLGVDEEVALVVEHEVLDVHAASTQRVDDPIGLGLHHAGVVGALHDQQRGADVVDPADRRAGD
jgi:hypothetical protein